MVASGLILPAGATLLHIGPRQTGAPALQASLLGARATLADFGVVYAGMDPRSWLAVLGVPGECARTWSGGPRKWHRLVRRVQDAGDRRVVVSIELLQDADAEAARRIVSALGGSRVHVLCAVGPLTEAMPAAWQRYVRNGLRMPYGEWLHAVLSEPSEPRHEPTTLFWAAHRHDVLLERWAQVAGADRVTAVVVQDADPNVLPDTVERMLGLPPGVLHRPRETVTRSLTAAELELVRKLNVERWRRGWSEELYQTVVVHGVIETLRHAESGPDDLPLATPDWAVARIAELDASVAARIAATDVPVAGDLSVFGARDARSRQAY